MKKDNNKKSTLIIGAGAAGTLVVRQLQDNTTELLPVAFIDDNVRKHNLDILGIPVIAGIDQIEYYVQQLKIDNIVIAIPSLRRRELNAIFQECTKTKVKTQIIPIIKDLVIGKVSVNQFRDVQVEDLIGRELVELNIESISDYITNKVVLVTGAGGSIVQEFVVKFHISTPKS
ncbi:CoA-binding protein [Halalkalibacter nanhaiisediminis]|uniref:CoA-binding protein n=1 Tax=Halalkalibacter nanhaiisediminis TaxID=688079 RepID=A0A562QN54_9BACI|nr:CoA-binding protein [Halalkalibacter nanhaiisediminis]